MSHCYIKRILARIEELRTPYQIVGGYRVISGPERLSVMLCFLATGEGFKLLNV